MTHGWAVEDGDGVLVFRLKQALVPRRHPTAPLAVWHEHVAVSVLPLLEHQRRLVAARGLVVLHPTALIEDILRQVAHDVDLPAREAL